MDVLLGHAELALPRLADPPEKIKDQQGGQDHGIRIRRGHHDQDQQHVGRGAKQPEDQVPQASLCQDLVRVGMTLAQPAPLDQPSSGGGEGSGEARDHQERKGQGKGKGSDGRARVCQGVELKRAIDYARMGCVDLDHHMGVKRDHPDCNRGLGEAEGKGSSPGQGKHEDTVHLSEGCFCMGVGVSAPSLPTGFPQDGQ